MIRDTIEKIEAQLGTAGTALPEETRAELLALVATLRQEVSDLSQTNADQAHSIAGFTALSTHEAIRQNRDPQLLEPALTGLKHSVAGFEESHPRLVHVVNSLANALSNLGI